MASDQTWRVFVNDQQLNRVLTTYLGDLKKEVSDEGKAHASRFQTALAKNVPQNTGDLESTIQMNRSGNADASGWAVSIGEDDGYARYVEFGYKTAQGALVPGQRYFYPLVSRFNRRWKAGLRRAIKRVAGRFS